MAQDGSRAEDPQTDASPRLEEMSIRTKRMTLKKRLIKFVSKGKKSLPNVNLPHTKRSRSKTLTRLLDTDLLSEEQQVEPLHVQLSESPPQEPPPAPSKGTWLDTPLNHNELCSALHPFLKRTSVAYSMFSDTRYAAMYGYLTKLAEQLSITPLEDQGTEKKTLWKLTCKVSGVENLSNKVKQEAYLYCRFGVLLRTDWDNMQHQDLNTFQHQENVCFSSLLSAGGPEIIEFSLDDLEHKLLVVEVWGQNTKRRRNSSASGHRLSTGGSDPTQSVQSLDDRSATMLVFLGRACSGFQDIPLGTADRELAIFSHSKKHERGKVAIQLGFEVPKSGAPIQEVLESYGVLFKAIVRHESQKEGSEWTRNWSAELPPLARDLLLTHAKWYGIGTLQRVDIELGLLLDYHGCYGVKMAAFLSLLEQVKEALPVTTMAGSSGGEQMEGATATSHEGTEANENKPDSLQSSPPRSGPTSPSSARSEVTSPFSSEPLPFPVVHSIPKEHKIESENGSKGATDLGYSVDSEGLSVPGPQTIRQKEEGSRIYDLHLEQKLNELGRTIEDRLNCHLFLFDITKPEELEENLKVLQKLYSLRPFVVRLPSDRHFKTMLEGCIKNGIQHWISVCNAEAQPKSGGLQYNAKSLKAQAEACSAKCKEVKEHIGDLFKQFGVDYCSIFIQMIGSKLTELSRSCISKEKSLSLDRDTNILYYQAYLACRQVEKCASTADPSVLEELNIWSCYKHLVGSWIELACTTCKERIGKAVAIDEVVKVMDEATYSSSAVDANLFLHQMVSFWKSLDWPDVEQAFGYGLKHFENLGQCALDYVETCYQHLSEKYLFDSEGRISISERVCIFFNNVDQIRKQVAVVSQKLEIKPVGQQSADRSLEVLKSNTDQAIEQKVESFVEQICEKLTPEIVQRLRSPEEQQVEILEEYLAGNLQIFSENLLEEIFNKILQAVWKVTLLAIEEVTVENKYDSGTLHSTLMSLKDFFNAALSNEKLETPQYKTVLVILENRLVSTENLIMRCCSELARQQELAKTSKATCGQLCISVAYTTDSALELNVIQAKVNTTHKDGSSDIFVYVWLLPHFVFTECAKKKHKTQVVKGTLEPNFCKEFLMPTNKDCLKMVGSILALGVYHTKSKYLAGMCVLPCSEIPVLGEAGSTRSRFDLLMFTLPELKGGPMGELAVRHASQDTEATKFYKYLTRKLHISLQP